MKKYTLEEAENLLIGAPGSESREQYQFELNVERIGLMIQLARKRKSLTQGELGEMIGVKKAQISKLENNTGNVTINTVSKILTALDAKILMKVEFDS